MILHFYLFGCSFASITLLISLIKPNKTLLLRLLTIFFLFNVVCLSVYYNPIGMKVFVSILAVLIIYELSIHIQMKFCFFSLVTLETLFLYFFPSVIYFTLVPLYIISLTAFLKIKAKTYSEIYIFVFTLFFIGPSLFFFLSLATKGTMLLTFLFLLQLNDSFGYLFGKVFGKTHIFPNISEKKTLEGYFFSFLGIIIGIIVLHTLIPVFKEMPLWVDLITLGIFFIMGNIGDLIFSCVKRYLQIKDFSQILPGHGGILDRLDNILFSCPIFYLFVIELSKLELL